MKFRRQNIFETILLKSVIDPVLGSSALRNRLKAEAKQESRWIGFLLRWVLDPTILPPPGYTRARADVVYGDSFVRMFEYLRACEIEGPILEFGTLLGYTAHWFASLSKKIYNPGDLWLYDSFAGLPEIYSPVDQTSYEVAVTKAWFHGHMAVVKDVDTRIRSSLERIVQKENVHLVKGYFEDTLETNRPEQKAAVIHIDSDLYASANFILEVLLRHDMIQDGCLLLMDDYNCNRSNPGLGERKALAEFLAKQDRFTVSPWFSYGWHGQVFFVHDSQFQ